MSGMQREVRRHEPTPLHYSFYSGNRLTNVIHTCLRVFGNPASTGIADTRILQAI